METPQLTWIANASSEDNTTLAGEVEEGFELDEVET